MRGTAAEDTGRGHRPRTLARLRRRKRAIGSVDSQKAYGDGVPYHAQWIELEPVVKEHVQRAVRGETTVDQALKDLLTAMEPAFKAAIPVAAAGTLTR